MARTVTCPHSQTTLGIVIFSCPCLFKISDPTRVQIQPLAVNPLETLKEQLKIYLEDIHFGKKELNKRLLILLTFGFHVSQNCG